MVVEQQSIVNVDPLLEDGRDEAEYIAVEQLRHLVSLIDQSDVAELEVTYAAKKTRLVLRKAKALAGATQSEILSLGEEIATSLQQQEPPCTIRAHLVGIFQCWSKSKDKPLVAVGDIIKEGQHVGVVRSLDIPNEIEAPVTGRVLEILVQDGELVEYGQALMTVARDGAG
jgi:acetyl-CoA carboxylase biotin carboxyl carrier protein